MRGQVSTELMIIIGAILVIFIPLLVTVYFKTGEANDTMEAEQSQHAVSRLANTINSIGNLGEGAFMRTEVFIPKNARQISFYSVGRGGEVTFKIIDGTGKENDFAEVVKYQLTELTIDNPPQGVATFEITRKGDMVEIKKV